MASLQKQGNVWYAVLSERDANGKRKQRWVSLKTSRKREAQDKLVELESSILKGGFVSPNRLTTAEYLRRWLDDHASASVRARTFQGYRTKVENSIVPHIGGILLRDLKPETIQRLYQQLLASGRVDGGGGLSARSVVHVHRVLSEALKQAVAWHLLASNPCSAVTPPRAKSKEMNVLDESGIGRLLDAASAWQDGFYFPVMHMLLYTGMRRSEVLALRWRDVDLDFGQAAITRSLHLPRGVKTPVFEQPKTSKSRRQVALSPASVGMLRQHLDRQRAICDAIGGLWTPERLIFCHPDTGAPLLPDTVTHAFGKIARRAGLEGVRLHDLRHSHATLMLKAGIHPKVVQERLGHSTIAMTLDLYSHVAPGMQEAAALRFDQGLAAYNERSGEHLPDRHATGQHEANY